MLRNVYQRILHTWLLILTPIMVFKGLQLITNCKHPFIYTDGSSMEPTLHRGDLLLLTNVDPVKVGDIVSFTVKERGINVLHRVIRVHKTAEGVLKILTKGDNNEWSDQSLYDSGTKWLNREDIDGQARLLLPNFGLIFLYISEYVVIKLLFALMVLYWVIRQHLHIMAQILYS